MDRHCPDNYRKVSHMSYVIENKFLNPMTSVCKSVGFWDCIINPIYGCGVKITQDVNPIYVGLESSCLRDSKNVSFVDVWLV